MPLELILFDLDETLYPRDSGLLKEVGRRIRLWLCDHLGLTWEQAAIMQRDYFLRYGTTLSGLIAEQQVDATDYLNFVHDIPVEAYLRPNPALATMLAALTLRRAIYTNATQEYSWRVLRALGVSDCFERVISIEDVGLRNKVSLDAYRVALALLGARGDECVMVEDTPRNLQPAKALGMTTILVGTDGSAGQIASPGQDVDFVLQDVLDVGRLIQCLLEP
jgi:putative hydrolase of the HAD superfamily